MFQLYKKRDFNALINDTFLFLRAQGKNYFANYFLINGGLMLVLLLLTFLLGSIFFEGLFSGLGTPQGQRMLSAYFDSNTGLFVGTAITIALLAILLSLISVSFPVVYLDLLANGQQPTAGLIINGLKARAGRMVVFALASLITFLPIGVIFGIISTLLIIVLIGIPIGILVFSAITCCMMLVLYDNLSSERTFFKAFETGLKMVFSNFWVHIGKTAIFLVMYFAIQLAFALLSSFISTFIYYITGSLEETGFGIITLAFFLVSAAVNYFFGSIFMLAHGMIYYSCRDLRENKSTYSEIDSIGNYSE